MLKGQHDQRRGSLGKERKLNGIKLLVMETVIEGYQGRWPGGIIGKS